MMNRRRFFGLLPLSLVAAVLPAKAEEATVVNVYRMGGDEPSPWVEMTCQGQDWHATASGEDYFIPCGQRFKVLRVGHPYCPKCGRLQNTGMDGVRDKFMGIPC